MNKALIVVSFGTTVPSAEACIQGAETAIREACPDRDFFRAYSSGRIRKKLREQGREIPGPEELTDSLLTQGYEEILVQPTFLIPGVEYDRLCAAVGDKVQLGKPLLTDPEDLMAVARVLQKIYCREGKALLLMGHGTNHLANFIFPALQTAFRILGEHHCYVATVEGWPGLSDAIAQMKRDGIRDLTLAPFLLVAGDHVLHDMTGGEDSWLAILQREGFRVDCVCAGLGELPEFLQLYQRKTQV